MGVSVVQSAVIWWWWKKWHKKVKDFDAIIIETTGLADPAPVAQTFFIDGNALSSMGLLQLLIQRTSLINLTTRNQREWKMRLLNKWLLPTKFLDEDQEHEHDPRVSSTSTKFEGYLNVNKLQSWISIIIRTIGADLFRYKGVLCVAGMEAKFVFQGVGMLFAGGFSDQMWGKAAVVAPVEPINMSIHKGLPPKRGRT